MGTILTMTTQRTTRRRRERRRMARTIDARRRLSPSRERPAPAGGLPAPVHGRAWINGIEVGGADPRYAHLARSHD